jgi:thioredoxin reductase (NADPH)
VPVHQSESLDCLIVGGGPAGLTAAIYLARFRRTVAVLDNGQSRAALIPETHNYPGFADGISGFKLLTYLREQAHEYGAALESGSVTAIKPEGDSFQIEVSAVWRRAHRVLLATGLTDRSPAMPGLKQAVQDGKLRYCPVCDAYESMDKRIGVLGPVQQVAKKALFLRTYSRCVVILTTDSAEPSDETAGALRAADVATARTVDVHPHGEGFLAILLDGSKQEIDILYPMLGCDVHSELGAKLGAHCSSEGCLLVDDRQRTSVTGLYAAGDVVSDLHQLSVAAGHAAVAATAIHNSLPANFR